MTDHYSIDMSSNFNCGLQDSQFLLSKALENRNLRDFRIALDIDADPSRTDANNISLFEKALQTYGCGKFVEECLKRGCKYDYINRRLNKAPINFAADSRDPKIFSQLLKYKDIPVNTKYANLTALNSLAKSLNSDNVEEVFECIQMLLEFGANPNIPDQKEMTPILYVINNKKIDSNKKREIIKYFLDSAEVDLDTFRDGEAREKLESNFPDLRLPEESAAYINFESLVTLIRNGNEERFIKEFNEYRLNLSEHDNQQNAIQEEYLTVLMEAIKNGMNSAVDVILKTDFNVNLLKNGNSAIEIAAIWGNWKALQSLLDHDEIKLRTYENLLITVIKKLDEQNNNSFSDYWKCFYTILDSEIVDINETDKSGTSALHYAVKYKNEKAIRELLRKGAYIGTKSAFNDLPISEINADLLEEFFDSCITTNGAKPGDDNFEIHINYKNLIPSQGAKTNKMINHSVREEMVPISHIAESKELRHLLQHPLITSFLFLKWHRLSVIFYVNFLIYTLFCVSLVTFIILHFGKSENATLLALFGVITFIGLIYLILREVTQFLMSPRYFIQSTVNYLEIILIVLTIITLSVPDYDNETQRVLAVFTVLLASIELCLLVGSLPVLSISTHMLMLRAVSTTFLKSFTLYSIFVITFSLCFYILFGKQKNSSDSSSDGQGVADGENADSFNKFGNPFTAVIKTIVMLTGEFDAGDIDFNSFYSYLVFLLFVFFMSIVLFNLLNGLAVSDTQAIKSQAELNGSICRAILLKNYELVLTGKDGKTSFVTRHEPFRSFCVRLTNLFPHYISGNHIAILPNNKNKVLIPVGNIIGVKDMQPNSNGDTVVFLNPTDDNDREKRLLDPPIRLLPCFCACLYGRCSEMDNRTVKTALAIIYRKQHSLKEKKKMQETEDRLKKIEEKLDKMFALFQERFN